MRVAAIAACALALSACATLEPSLSTPAAEPVADGAFDVSGRLSARRGAEGAAANFDWAHAPGQDTIALATPMGTTLARLSRDSDGASLERPDRPVERARDAATLADRVLGFALPVESLAWWIRGVPHPGTPHALERDTAGRTAVLRQDGWSVAYGYADGATQARRLVATYPDLEVRVVIDAWR
ncbi:MAG: lipoprotein insertase outer membrane protein LolB [Betaproteobacteria bacterium]